MEDYYSIPDDTIIGMIASFFLAYFLIALIIAIVCYVFTSLALYQMAKNRNIENPWLAWIPIANMYLMGKLLYEKVAFGSSIIPMAHVILPLLPIVCGILAFIPYIGWLFPIVNAVYYCAALYRLFRLYKPDNAVLYLVLSIIFPVLQPFFLFSMRRYQDQEYLSDTPNN